MNTITLIASVAACGLAAPCWAFDLKRLPELEQSKLTPAQRSQMALRLYREEMVHRTPAPKPPYTDPITHDYVLAQITRKLAAGKADTKALKKTWETMNAGEVKDSLAIYLVLTGDPAAKDAVSSYVVDRAKPLRLRELGVTALGKLAVKTTDPKLGDVLAQVLREDTQGQYQAAKGSPKPVKVTYPVRRAARDAIRGMEKAGLLLPSYVTQAAGRAEVETKLPTAKSEPQAQPKS